MPSLVYATVQGSCFPPTASKMFIVFTKTLCTFVGTVQHHGKHLAKKHANICTLKCEKSRCVCGGRAVHWLAEMNDVTQVTIWLVSKDEQLMYFVANKESPSGVSFLSYLPPGVTHADKINKPPYKNK